MTFLAEIFAVSKVLKVSYGFFDRVVVVVVSIDELISRLDLCCLWAGSGLRLSSPAVECIHKPNWVQHNEGVTILTLVVTQEHTVLRPDQICYLNQL